MKKPANETRQHILDVARTLMTTKGYTAVGLAEVVAAASVPKGSFYYYFKSKEDCGRALLEEYFADYLATVDRFLSAPGKGADRLLSYVRYWSETQAAETTDGKCLVVKLGPEVCDLSGEMRGVLHRGTRTVIGRIADCIEAGKKDGSISSSMPSDTLAQILYQQWLGASLLAKVDQADAPFETAVTVTLRLLQ